jgi:hypothetical protein
MAEQSWWRRSLAAINREYERRIRRASQVTEYGADHHAHTNHEDEVEAAAIVNVPRGTPLRRSAPPPAPDAESESPTPVEPGR